MSLVLIFTADFIHSDQPLNYLNRLTVYTVSIDRFTPLYFALRRFTSSLIWQLTQISATFVSVFCFLLFLFSRLLISLP